MNNSYDQAIKFLKDHNIYITNMCINIELNTKINIYEFAKNIILDDREIISVFYGDGSDPLTNRSIDPSPTKIRRVHNCAYVSINQSTRIHTKIFQNGHIQIIGTNLEDSNNVVKILIKNLEKYAENTSISIKCVKYSLINANFKFNNKIKCTVLAKILSENHNEDTIDTNIGYVKHKYENYLIIKYTFKKREMSIFVFESGAIITGAKKLTQIIKAYNYIQKIITTYHNKIIPFDKYTSVMQ